MVNRNAGLVTSGASLPLGNDSCYHHAPLPSSTATIDAINRRIYRHRWLVSSAFYTEIRPGKRRRGLPLLDEREPLRRCEVSDPLPLLPINLGESSRTERVLSNTNALHPPPNSFLRRFIARKYGMIPFSNGETRLFEIRPSFLG